MKGGSRSIAALVASALLASPALADPRSQGEKPPSEKDRQLASELVKKAIARSQAGDHSAAIEIYLQAFTIVPNSLLLSNIGAEFQQSGMPKEAYKYFCMYLEKDPSGTNAPYATSQAKILARQLHKKVDAQDVCAPPKEEPDEPPPPRGPKRPERAEPPPPPPPATIEARRDRGSPGVMYTGVVAGVAGIAAGGGGVYFGIQSKNISDQINSHDPKQPWPPNIRDLMKQGDRDNSLAIGFLVASGVLVTTGVVLYVVSRPDGAERTSDKAAIHVTPTTNGLAVFGRF
ncbi:MAG TPA: tetratricopeptide repeat protein [Kofleriaceae bacterium]